MLSAFSSLTKGALKSRALWGPSLSRCKHIAAVDGNEAAGYIGYGLSDVCMGYPITPASQGFELNEMWSNEQRMKNCFGEVPGVFMLESEAGVAGALHGALSGGTLACTYTSCQGLMLMIPNMYKMGIAGLPAVIHVSARTVSRTSVCIFPDHTDVMTTRPTGWGMVASGNPQEVNDLGMAAHLTAIKGRVPFLHFFDGFRTSHAVMKIERLDYPEMAKLIPMDMVKLLRSRAFNPENPRARGSCVNNDVYMQFTEIARPWFLRLPNLFEETLRDIGKVTGRHYKLFDYVGHPEPEYVIMLMGSAAQTADEAVNHLNRVAGNKYGVIKVRLYRPFSAEHLLKAIPKSVKKIGVLDRTRENGAFGEPLYLDVAGVLSSVGDPRPVVNTVYGLGGKDFTPTMVKTIFENLKSDNPKRSYTIGAIDDVTGLSLPLDKDIDMCPPSTKQCLFWGVGADGTVGANHEAISIISHNTNLHAQGYFAFEAKKSGGWTCSHLRFGPEPVKAEYEIKAADYVACHCQAFLKKYPVIDFIKENGTLVVNSTAKTLQDIEAIIPDHMKKMIADRNVKLFTIDATQLAEQLKMRGRINMIMQTVFFKLSQVTDLDLSIRLLKDAVHHHYAKKGDAVVKSNIDAIDQALKNLIEVKYPKDEWAQLSPVVKSRFDRHDVKKVGSCLKDSLFPMMDFRGNDLPISAFKCMEDGYAPTGTSQYERRDIAIDIPTWDAEKCTQCNRCVMMCPHACIRPFLLTEEEVKKVPVAKDAAQWNSKTTTQPVRKLKEKLRYRIQVSPRDCLSCTVCYETCPDGALTMVPVGKLDLDLLERQWDYMRYSVPHRGDLFENPTDIRTIQFQEPLLEFTAACAGCGETPYIKLITQMYGDRMVISNAHGCTIVWAGAYPSIGYSRNKHGHGPSWGSSLFEDAAEFGFGMAKAWKHRRNFLAAALTKNAGDLPAAVKERALSWTRDMYDAKKSIQHSDAIKSYFKKLPQGKAMNGTTKRLFESLDILRLPSQWIIGGDGWAYDIGYNGLDHIMAQDENVNILVLDNEAYANTGFQLSKATPHGGIVKFAASGNRGHKKDLGSIAMTYGHIYVASICMGSNATHTIRAIREAESYNGPSLIIAYCPCIGHGIHGELGQMERQQRLAVETGYWPLYRFDPRLAKQGKNPLQLDSKPPAKPVKDFISLENRFHSLTFRDPKSAAILHSELQDDVNEKWKKLLRMAKPW